MKFTTTILLALSAGVNSASLQKRDVSNFIDSIKNVTADFIVADSAIAGVGAQLHATRQALLDGSQLLLKEAVLSDTDTIKALNEYAQLMKQITTTMNHFGNRRAVISQSSECKDTWNQLVDVHYWATVYSGTISARSNEKLKYIADGFGTDLRKSLKDQLDALACA